MILRLNIFSLVGTVLREKKPRMPLVESLRKRRRTQTKFNFLKEARYLYLRLRVVHVRKFLEKNAALERKVN